MLSREQAAYVAGVIDGEGHLGVTRVRPSGRNRNAVFTATVRITNTNLGWLEGLQGWIGGRINRTDSLKRRNRRPCYDLRLGDRQSQQALLVAIQPYLRLKRAHADVLFRYFALAVQRREYYDTHRGQVGEASTLDAMQALYAELQTLNLRGKVQDWSLERPQFNRKCRMAGCDRPHASRGYCKVHYKKYITRGGPAWHERTCQQCSKPFVSKRSDARCCSKACASADYHGRHPRTAS